MGEKKKPKEKRRTLEMICSTWNKELNSWIYNWPLQINRNKLAKNSISQNRPKKKWRFRDNKCRYFIDMKTCWPWLMRQLKSGLPWDSNPYLSDWERAKHLTVQVSDCFQANTRNPSQQRLLKARSVFFPSHVHLNVDSPEGGWCGSAIASRSGIAHLPAPSSL